MKQYRYIDINARYNYGCCYDVVMYIYDPVDCIGDMVLYDFRQAATAFTLIVTSFLWSDSFVHAGEEESGEATEVKD